MRKPLLVVVAIAAVVALVAPQQATATKKQPHLTVLSTDFAAPFNVSVHPGGIFVADGGPGIVARLQYNGDVTPLVTNAIGASGIAKKGSKLAYTTTESDPTTFENTASALNIKGSHATTKANTLRFERNNNPDKVNTYGFAHPTQCQKDVLGPDAQYTGRKDSHAYSVASWRDKWIVADAGSNTLLTVSPNGSHIKTLTVFPPQPAVITEEFVEQNGLPPECFVGSVYGFEPVPTDVEVGKNGMLYVTTLPGGDETPALGARGALWRVNPWNGHATKIVGGFLGATNLAIGNRGQIYVTELFAGRISVVWGNHATPYVDLPGVVAVERGLRNGNLIAGTLDPTFSGPGSVVRVGPQHKVHPVS